MSTNAPHEEAVNHQNAEEQAHAHLNSLFTNDVAKGAPVHSFNPDAPPQDKAAAISEGAEKLKRPSVADGGAKGTSLYIVIMTPYEPSLYPEVPIDTGGTGVVPTITVEDADMVTKEEQETSPTSPPGTPSTPSPPGALPPGATPAIPDWYKVGWRAVANIDAPPLEEGDEKDKSVLQLYLNEQFYGDWYHNAALIFFVRPLLHTF
jgi:hypothetical protein